jgi:hypothetical protein
MNTQAVRNQDRLGDEISNHSDVQDDGADESDESVFALDENGIHTNVGGSIDSSSDFHGSESEETDGDPGLQVVDTPPSDSTKEAKVRKRRYYDSDDQSASSANPTKKSRTESTSSIRTGLEKTEAAIRKKERLPGLFQYFRKATEGERKEYLARMDEETETQTEKEKHYTQKAKREQETRMRDRNRERKRLQRVRMKNLEIKSGLRSPGGTKRQVRLTVQLRSDK